MFSAMCGWLGMPSVRASRFAVPWGTIPSGTPVDASPSAWTASVWKPASSRQRLTAASSSVPLPVSGWYAYVTRELAYAPYADVLWLQTPEPDLAVARAFACIIHSQYPDKLLAYSCPPPSTGLTHQDSASSAQFQMELAAMGYQFQSAAVSDCAARGELTPVP